MSTHDARLSQFIKNNNHVDNKSNVPTHISSLIYMKDDIFKQDSNHQENGNCNNTQEKISLVQPNEIESRMKLDIKELLSTNKEINQLYHCNWLFREMVDTIQTTYGDAEKLLYQLAILSKK